MQMWTRTVFFQAVLILLCYLITLSNKEKKIFKFQENKAIKAFSSSCKPSVSFDLEVKCKFTQIHDCDSLLVLDCHNTLHKPGNYTPVPHSLGPPIAKWRHGEWTCISISISDRALTVQETAMDITHSFIRERPCLEGEKVKPILMSSSHPLLIYRVILRRPFSYWEPRVVVRLTEMMRGKSSLVVALGWDPVCLGFFLSRQVYKWVSC